MEGIHRQATLLFVLNSKLYQEIPPPSWKSSETEVVYVRVKLWGEGWRSSLTGKSEVEKLATFTNQNILRQLSDVVLKFSCKKLYDLKWSP